MLRRISHLGLAVKDLDASRQFYEKFGFAVFAGARLPDGRVVDRRKVFVRLLLMGGNSKGYSTE